MERVRTLHKHASSRDRLLQYARENTELHRDLGDDHSSTATYILDDATLQSTLETIIHDTRRDQPPLQRPLLSPHAHTSRRHASKLPAFRDSVSSDITSPESNVYEASTVLPDWILQHCHYRDVDRIIRNEQLCQALVEQPLARSAKQISLLEIYLLSVWPTAKRLGALRVREIAKTARFQQVTKGEYVVKEGERGVTFYILMSGTLEVVKQGVQKRLAVLRAGNSFGEASLGAGAPPRNASVICTSQDAHMLVLHKSDYDCIMKDEKRAAHRRAYRCIKNVPLFAFWSRARLHQTCSKLQWHDYKKGDEIIRQGEPCDNVYFIIEGRCEVSKCVHLRNQNRWPSGTRSWVTKTCIESISVKVSELGPNDYFGEKGILENSTRAATVKAIEDSVIVHLDRTAFLELLQCKQQNRMTKFYNFAGASNMGYATEQEIISVLRAADSAHDNKPLVLTSDRQSKASRKHVSVAGQLVNKNVESASAMGMLATGDLRPSKLLSLERSLIDKDSSLSTLDSSRKGSLSTQPETQLKQLAPIGRAQSGELDENQVTTSQLAGDGIALPKREIDSESADVQKAKEDLEARWQLYRERIGIAPRGVSLSREAAARGPNKKISGQEVDENSSSPCQAWQTSPSLATASSTNATPLTGQIRQRRTGIARVVDTLSSRRKENAMHLNQKSILDVIFSGSRQTQLSPLVQDRKI